MSLAIIPALWGFFIYTDSPVLGTTDKSTKEIDAGIYWVAYSQEFEQPLKVTYQVLCPTGTASRAGMDFYGCDSVHTSDYRDYAHNVWDKGHMAPAADFNCTEEMLRKTFSYLNCALQHQTLNRGPWKQLEAYERKLASSYPNVNVEIYILFDNFVKLPTGARVPSGFVKKIYVNGKVLTYRFPNEACNRDFSTYQE